MLDPRLAVLALVSLTIAGTGAVEAAPTAPGPLGPEFPAEDRPVPEESWWSSCADAHGVTSTIVPACVGVECPDSDDLFLERTDATGAPLAPRLWLNEGTAYRSLFRLSCHPNGWVVAQWRDLESECYLHRLIEPDGDPAAPPLRTAPPGNDCRARASIGVRSDGTFLATWGAAHLTGGSGVILQAFDANAGPKDESLTLTEMAVGWNRLPKVAIDDEDVALVAWSGDSFGSGPQPVLARFIDASVVPLGDAMRLDTFGHGENSPPAVASDGSGSFTVIWSNPILGGRVARRVGLSRSSSPVVTAEAVGHTPADLPHFGAARLVDSRDVASIALDARVRSLDDAGESSWLLGHDDGPLQHTNDDGIAWSAPIALQEDSRRTLAVDATPAGSVVALTRKHGSDTLDATRSSNLGATWMDPKTVATLAADPIGCMSCRVVRADVEGSDDGIWVAAWAVTDRVRESKAAPWRKVQRIAIARSVDGGKTWDGVARIDAATGVAQNGFDLHRDRGDVWVLAWMDEDLHVVRSRDGGRSWSAPTTIASDLACVDCAVSRRAPRLEMSDDGNDTWAMIFAAARYRTGTYGYDSDVFVTRSIDAGLTWTEPQPLAPYAPADGSREIDPTIATNGDGRWVAAWTSHRPLGPDDSADPDVVLSMSNDGGATWSAPAASHTEIVGRLTLDGGPLLAVDANGVWMNVWHSVPYDDDDGVITASVFSAAADADCGNGIVEPGESCDDANAKNGDGCDANCTSTDCGNGIATRREECDDGNRRDDDACTSDCRAAICGDGFVHAHLEECDDGNASDDDECPASCRLTVCGDGSHDPLVEECDDGNELDNDDCVAGCKPARCGDGFVHDHVEACDDGNAIDDDACPNTCDNSVCGDGHTSVGFEPCDPADPAYAEVCTIDCRMIDLCGDADGDGHVSVIDVQRILSRGIGLGAHCPREACDMDSSGAVRVSDAQLGVATVVGLDVGDRCSIGTGNIVFWIDYVGDIGALQLEARYGETGGEFVGSGSTVSCIPLLEGVTRSDALDDPNAPPPNETAAFVTFNDEEDETTLHAAFVSLPGFSGPIDLFGCAFVMPADRQSARFELKTVDAADTELQPIVPLPLFGYRLE